MRPGKVKRQEFEYRRHGTQTLIANFNVVFHFTPKHCSWLNQIEIWFSILTRKLLRRGSFRDKADLKEQILSFIHYFNEKLAHPFKWTFEGKLLVP